VTNKSLGVIHTVAGLVDNLFVGCIVRKRNQQAVLASVSFAMLCHATPCYAMLCHAMPCCAMLCHAMGTDRACVGPAGQKGKASSAPQASHAGTGQGPQPTQVEKDVVSEGWAAVGGHASVIQQLKEMVLLPLQYPEVFKHMGITPPRCDNQQDCTVYERLKGSLQAHAVDPHAGGCAGSFEH